MSAASKNREEGLLLFLRYDGGRWSGTTAAVDVTRARVYRTKKFPNLAGTRVTRDLGGASVPDINNGYAIIGARATRRRRRRRWRRA